LGVKTQLTLKEAQNLFKNHTITKLIPTTSGIMDTTYISDNFIIKKYERVVDVKNDIRLLELLKSSGLNVPTCQEQNKEWFLYEKLEGDEVKNIQTYHIVALARFMAKFHSTIYKHRNNFDTTHLPKTIDKDEINKLLKYPKQNFFSYYKKLQPLKDYNSKSDGLIHGDIFKDNTLFKKQKIAVFDFIDSSYGSFSFDLAVCLVGFGARKNNYFINLFLQVYNQKAPRKITKKELSKEIDMACGYYALKRINGYKDTKKAKELL